MSSLHITSGPDEKEMRNWSKLIFIVAICNDMSFRIHFTQVHVELVFVYRLHIWRDRHLHSFLNLLMDVVQAFPKDIKIENNR